MHGSDERMTINKVKGIVLTIFAIALVTVLIVIATANNKKSSEEYEIIDDIADVALNSTGAVMLYFGSESCEECVLQGYQMKLFLSNYGLQYYYVNLDGISKSESKEILSKLSLNEDISFPTIAIYENGELSVTQSGLTGTNSLYNTFKDYDLIEDKGLKLDYLTLIKYVEKVEGDTFALAVGSMKSQESMEFEEVLWEVADEYGTDISFIYASNLSKIEGELFESKLYNLEDYDLTIPSLLIISKNRIKNVLTDEATTKDDVVIMLKAYELIEE